MTLRHFVKSKPSVTDHLEAWSNYTGIFEFLLQMKFPEVAVSAQWANDIVQEFVYHFQDFCQYRAQVSARTEEEIARMQACKTAWSLPEVVRILTALIARGNESPGLLIRTKLNSDILYYIHSNALLVCNITVTASSSVHSLMSYFSAIELARLECLLGDFGASLTLVSPRRLRDKSELFQSIPTCHANAYYHAGICLLLSRKYTSCVDTLTEIIIHISRQLKPGAAVLRQNTQQALQKALDKVMALTLISIVLSPGHRVDDQVQELIDAKWSDRLRRLQTWDLSAFEAIFESNCPKFISPAWPDFTSTTNPCNDTMRSHVILTAMILFAFLLAYFIRIFSFVCSMRCSRKIRQIR